MNKVCHRVVLVLTAALLCSCAAFRPKLPAATTQPHQQLNEIAKKAEGNPYVLGADDVVRIIVEQHPEWSGEFTVRPDSTIFIQGIGEFSVQGLTKSTAEIAFAAHLEQYINNPRVTVDIVRYASQVIYVMGAVNRPGRYPTEGKLITLRDALIMASFPGQFAALDRVYVITPSQGKPTQQVINAERILNRGELKRNIQLNPGDIVYVPQTVLGKIVQFVGSLFSPISTAALSARNAMVPVP